MKQKYIKQERLQAGIKLKETVRCYIIESHPRKGSIRERCGTTVKKTGDLDADLKKLEIAKASVISHYNAMEIKASIGTIIKDEEYTIRGLSMVAGKQGNDKTRISINLAVRRTGETPYCRSIMSYSRFVEVWHVATDYLVKFHGLESKPKEWIESPSELYYDRLQKRLIEHKVKQKKAVANI